MFCARVCYLSLCAYLAVTCRDVTVPSPAFPPHFRQCFPSSRLFPPPRPTRTRRPSIEERQANQEGQGQGPREENPAAAILPCPASASAALELPAVPVYCLPPLTLSPDPPRIALCTPLPRPPTTWQTRQNDTRDPTGRPGLSILNATPCLSLTFCGSPPPTRAHDAPSTLRRVPPRIHAQPVRQAATPTASAHHHTARGWLAVSPRHRRPHPPNKARSAAGW